jgi:hypothetical protein
MISWYLPVWKKGLGTRQIQKDACGRKILQKDKSIKEWALVKHSFDMESLDKVREHESSERVRPSPITVSKRKGGAQYMDLSFIDMVLSTNVLSN